jgi:PHD/YefM family antitoxin component YafN of YafNO toxin-antitoxin module
MRAITLQEAARSFETVMQSTLANAEETVIVSDAGAVVIVQQQYWEELQETLRLLYDKTSLQALLEGHRERERTGSVSGKSPNEVFGDVQH